MALLRERASLSSLRERQINGRWSKWLRKWNDFENEMTSKMKWLRKWNDNFLFHFWHFLLDVLDFLNNDALVFFKFS
jgi:hypothetical protein